MIRVHRGVVVLFAGLVCSTSVNAEVPYRTIVLSDQQLPSLGSGVTVGTLGSPTINDAGEVVFAAGLQGPGTDTTNDSSLWLARANGLHLVARESQPAAGMPSGVVYDQLWHASNARPGHVAFSGRLRGPSISTGDNFAIWTGAPSSLQVIAQKGSPAPGTSSTFNFDGPHVSAFGFTRSGQTSVFAAAMPGAGHGLFAGNGSLAPVAFGLMPVPGLGPDVMFGSFNPTLSSINSAGQTAFTAPLIGSGIDASNDWAIWTGTPGNVRVVAREGAPAPGTAASFGSPFAIPHVNSDGQVLFLNQLTGSGVNEANDVGLWTNSGASSSLLVREGDAAPGTSALIRDLVDALPAGERVVFTANLAGDGVTENNDRGHWIGTPDNFTLLAREGDAAPGIGGDAELANLALIGANDRGHALFYGRVRGEGIDETNQSALWLTDDEAGELHLLVRAGDLIEVAPGDVRQIRSIPTGVTAWEISGGDDGRPIILNDQGEVALRLSFTDESSGIFVISIPEPLAITLLPATALLLRRRR